MKTAYPSVQGTCKITLYSNIPFDNSYQHHTIISRLFKDDGDRIYNATDSTYGAPCERFINRRNSLGTDYYYPRWTLTGDFNFNFSNGLISSVVLELTPAQTNANYMKLETGDDVYYYFVTGITQNNYDTYTLSLELDALMTYQDEFLQGIAGKPVFTKRKHSHRYTSNGYYPHCADLLSNEEIFSGVKTNHVKDIISLSFKNVADTYKEITWLYVCVDLEKLVDDDNTSVQYSIFNSQGTRYPLSIIALPINVGNFKLYSGETLLRTTTSIDVVRIIGQLINDGSVHGAKISKYPPVEYSSSKTTYDSVTKELTFKFDSFTSPVTDWVDSGTLDGVKFTFTRAVIPDSAPIIIKLIKAGLLVREELDCKHHHKHLTSSDLQIVPATPVAPTITSARFEDIKLKFSPFTKYTLSAGYSSDGVELYPELFYACVPQNSATDHIFELNTITSTYIGDNNIFTYPSRITYTRSGVNYTPFNYYNLQKNGLASSMNYITPVGENALDVFNATQANAFYQSKLSSGITSGLSVAGGIASIVAGSGMVATSGIHAGSLTPMGFGLVASGVTAIAGGVAGASNTILSANAKIQDLKNTPDSINISGSNFTTDMAVTEKQSLPFIIISECSPLVKQNADDFLYQYGYQVARECYFNQDTDYDYDEINTIDTHLFGRTIFNYIQLDEDITNKINADIPLIIKKKLSSIFNNGITIWNFFGFQELWRDRTTPSFSQYQIDKYFLQHTYDNTEYKGQTF